ncbi:MAG: type I-B CRISPR-associated protein Cas7/Csh2 [Planctomycetes bacterium]|nr:type I-B CRISPR-associated protein Cas7/Csh2 [Planctomycetota bacterium]
MKRTEIVYLYDIIDANPNGDPNDENRPRMDAESGCAKVSDVRLKRTIRDYLHESGGQEIFCRQIEKSDGTIQAGKDRAEDFFEKVTEKARNEAKTVLDKRALIEAEVLKACIDVRLFGATIPIPKLPKNKNEKDSSVTLTGPVQFAMGTSLHRVEPRFIKGTGAFASGQGAQQKTFREEYVLPYALIAFYGIVNEQAAKTTKLTDEDVEALFESVWYGTKNLITRSKFGQRPLLLLLVEYSEPNAYIGRLDRFLKIKPAELRGEAIRDVGELTLDLAELASALNGKKAKIHQLRYAWDKRLKLSQEPQGDQFMGCSATNLNYE